MDKLSGGQTQRVRFALAIVGESDLIVLDEPTTAMDVEDTQRGRCHQWGARDTARAKRYRSPLFAIVRMVSLSAGIRVLQGGEDVKR